MAKVEIEVPNGKIAEVTKNGDKVIVTFKEENLLDSLKDIVSVKYRIKSLALDGVKWAKDLWDEYSGSEDDSYSEKICLYRMVVAALTNNEKRHLTTGERWYPVVQFCRPKDVKNCWGNEIIGTIISEGTEYTIVGGSAHSGSYAGLGAFSSDSGVSASGTNVGFRSVSSKEVALHISKYFGKLLFEVHYRGVNCDWHWKK